ncbi:aspartyl/asparaginyl beta-hydroxylase domain-containing protein [Shewanella goraebulensis]|uniref:aspartyl/asparaginyl beta-hydroxylase domain-containing protein n=1 Tax=Shewanella goraebulensis TaxID=3050637 RepID=UPI00254A016F|nr:aspartyl/asparaginyl beta-hydroxylase domain-containing protein [Shewanella goraebulensis]
MKLPHEFYQLPYLFDINRLIEEIEQFSDSDWFSHHEGFPGNSAIPLISVNGEFNNDFKGPMKPTSALDKCPYIKQILSSFGEVLSRSRLMRLAPGAQVPLHSDINYHWYKRVRVHIPITTNTKVKFFCHDKQVHMGAGECWIFDSWKLHKVENNSEDFRVHLVVDLAGSSKFWRTIFQESYSISDESKKLFNAQIVEFNDSVNSHFNTEKFNAPVIMPVSEVEYLCSELLKETELNTENTQEQVLAFSLLLGDFVADWRVLWLQYQSNREGWTHYHALRQQVMQKAIELGKSLQLIYSGSVIKAFEQLVIVACMNIDLSEQHKPSNEITRNSQKKTPPIKTTETDLVNKSNSIAAPQTRNSPCPCGSGKRYKTCHGKMN